MTSSGKLLREQVGVNPEKRKKVDEWKRKGPNIQSVGLRTE